jgi:hypothetical protein
MARGAMPPDEGFRALPDDYVIDRDERRETPFITLLVRALRFFLVLAMAALSLALFWVVGTMLGLF